MRMHTLVSVIGIGIGIGISIGVGFARAIRFCNWVPNPILRLGRPTTRDFNVQR